MHVSGRVVLAALRRKYNSECAEWSLQDGHHSKLPEGSSKLMVLYATESGIRGRQWLETIERWAHGDTNYCFAREHGLG